jgi:hypothetical protein
MDGTTATSADASRSAYSRSPRPCVKVIRSDSPAASRRVCSAGFPTTTRRASLSVITLANACSRVGSPFSGESELDTVTIRPGTRARSRGRNSRVSTPSGTTFTMSGLSLKSLHISALDALETVMTGEASRRATRACIRTNPYHLRRDSACPQLSEARSIRRSTLIGWWMLVTTGSPRRLTPSMP